MSNLRKSCYALKLVCLLGLVSSALAQTEQTTPPAAPQPTQSVSTPSYASSGDEASDSKWHVYGTGYLWFPGVHGEVGVRGLDVGVHVSAIDLLEHFRFGIMGAVIPSYNRWSMPVDYLFVRLRDDKTIPFFPNYAAQVKLTESIFTPKVALLVVNKPKLKVYGTAGPRIWHLGTTLDLDPTILGYAPYKSVNWADFVVGSRFSMPLSTKASVDILGDAGAGGANLDYQVGGFLNYKVKPKLALQAGWRYLTVHYDSDGDSLNMTMEGIIAGVTYKFK